jgi:hypothetical protein
MRTCQSPPRRASPSPRPDGTSPCAPSRRPNSSTCGMPDRPAHPSSARSCCCAAPAWMRRQSTSGPLVFSMRDCSNCARCCSVGNWNASPIVRGAMRLPRQSSTATRCDRSLCRARPHRAQCTSLMLEAPRADGIQLMKRIVDSRDDPSDADRAGIAESLARQLGELDPLAHIELVMRCPECAHDWSEPLYFIDVLWTEIGALASRLIQEVAHLAHAFGWREADILAMSPRRRQRYLEQLAA